MLPFGGLETYSLPSSALKSLNGIFVWNVGNDLNTCLSFQGSPLYNHCFRRGNKYWLELARNLVYWHTFMLLGF